MKTLYILYALLIAGMITSCKQQDGEEEAMHDHPPAGLNEVSLTREQFNAIGIVLSPLQERTLSNTIKANGTLNLPPQNKASVSALLGGTIKLIHVIEGEYVKKGQKLALVENPEYIQLQQDYLEARSRYAYLEKEYARQKTLADEKIVAAKKFQQAEAEFEAQRAKLRSLEDKLSLMGLSPAGISRGNLRSGVQVTAPISGFVHRVNANTGSYAEPQREIFQIVDNHHIHIDLHIFQDDLTRVREGQKVYFTLSGHEEEAFEAVIFATGKAFDEGTRSVTVHAEIKDNKHSFLLPGMYVDARIVTQSNTVNALPEEAIISDGDLQYIFVLKNAGSAPGRNDTVAHDHDRDLPHTGPETKNENMLFEKVLVKTGTSDGGYVQVTPLQELPAGTRIAVKGAYYLAAEMKKAQGADDDHGH